MTEEANRISHSPYAIFEGEECTADEIKVAVTKEELSYLLRNKFIGEAEQRIIGLIRKHKILNSRQITDLYEILYGTEDTGKIDNSVRKLCRKEFLQRYAISRCNSSAVRYVYTLGKYANVVTDEDELCYMQNPSVREIKSTLAANQLIISALRDNTAVEFSYDEKTALHGTAFLCLHIIMDSRDICAMVIRKTLRWEDELTNSTDTIKDRAKNGGVIIVCEDREQSETVRNLLDGTSNCIIVFDRQLHMKGLRECMG